MRRGFISLALDNIFFFNGLDSLPSMLKTVHAISGILLVSGEIAFELRIYMFSEGLQEKHLYDLLPLSWF
tara:strand:- start:120 stop:329 length:210 start_codon:yes stop_codon:yes gene_type:complete